MTDHGRLPTRVFVVALIVIAAGLVAASDILYQPTEKFIAWAQAMIAASPFLGALAFVALASASAMLFFFSSAVLFPVGVEAWGVASSMLLLWCGWLLGGALCYAVGYLLGRPVTEKLVGQQRLADLEQRLRGRARFHHVLLFQLTLPSEIPGYVLGTLRYPILKFLAALALAEIPFVLGTAFLGVSFLERRAGLLIAAGVAAIVLGHVAYRRWRRAHPAT